MSRKLIVFIVVFLVLAILAGIAYVFWGDRFFSSEILRPEASNIPEETTPETKAPVNRGEVARVNVNQPAEEETDNTPVNNMPSISVQQFSKSDLTRIAASFAERFGSYSNHSNFTNITDIKIYMSDNMQRWADAFVTEQRKHMGDTSIYYGITTKAVAEDVKQFDDDIGRAEVLVHTRRQEATGTNNNISNTFNQSISIKFINERGSWKVDKAEWQDK